MSKSTRDDDQKPDPSDPDEPTGNTPVFENRTLLLFALIIVVAIAAGFLAQ
jgi:hypothetical protein